MTEPDDPAAGRNACCGDGPLACVFGKALLAQAGHCGCAQRTAFGERLLVECGSPPAQADCRRLMALLHERARFALKLAPLGRPMLHQQALRLQCGSISALQATLQPPGRDVRQLAGSALARHYSTTGLPWPALVAAIAHWQTPRRRGPAP